MSQTPKLVAEIREAFLSYFEKQGHTRVDSASLIPANDPTLLFVSAGMVPFKDVFLGLDKRAYSRATSCQKSVRAGGKHNDLENVGFTSRHHTFFEMLGNFSFGDYFKKDAIHFAWEFSTKVLGLPKDKLRVSVFREDDEAAEIWHKQEGVPLDRIVRFDEADNFWQMGDTGPCGPCSEIFYDQGKEVDGDRWLEFWNCVFMQYDRSAGGVLNALPKPSVDTGMGLERMAAIMQGVPSNYDIDLMKQLTESAAALVSTRTKKTLRYEAGREGWEMAALKVIADHLRSTSFLIADGVLPSNEGRGYVLRRILRRAVRFGKRLGIEEPFLHTLYPELEKAMGDQYPELHVRAVVVKEILKQEEEKFFETLGRGLELLDTAFAKAGSGKVLPADVVFKLYDTYGFPEDLTALIAREKGLDVDSAGVAALMSKQQELSRASWKGSGEKAILDEVKKWKNEGVTPKFTGYEKDKEQVKVLAISKGEGGAWFAVDPCPFYAEGGGQVGDQGLLKSSALTLKVTDCQKPYDGGLAIYVEGDVSKVKVGDSFEAQVDVEKRSATRANHTATHLLHAALRKILGEHVQQAGSSVDSERLRFDFSHGKSISTEDLKKIEEWVNRAIADGTELKVQNSSYKEAVADGALALFGEKYGDQVRSIKIQGFSHELCGGLHVQNTSDIRLFKIESEGAVAAGTRRIEASTRLGAIKHFEEDSALLNRLAQKLKTNVNSLEERMDRFLEKERAFEKEIADLKRKLLSGSPETQVLEALYKGVPLLVHDLPDIDVAILREKADSLRKQSGEKIHVLLSGKKVIVTSDTVQNKNFHAGDLLKALGKNFGGQGGGQAQTAQGKLPPSGDLAKKIVEWINASS